MRGESIGPLVKRSNRVDVGAIEHLLAVAPHLDQPDIAEDPQVFRDRRLREPERLDNRGDGMFVTRQKIQNRPALRLGDRVETSELVAARATSGSYSDTGICQAERPDGLITMDTMRIGFLQIHRAHRAHRDKPVGPLRKVKRSTITIRIAAVPHNNDGDQSRMK